MGDEELLMLYLQTILVRAIQAFSEAAPTLLFGIVAAAYLRMVVGPEGTRRLFAGEGAHRDVDELWIARDQVLQRCAGT